MTLPVTVLTDRYVSALAYATAIHAGQLRKGTDVPYVAHLLGVSSLVLEAGGDEDQSIAGLLHDAVEDCGGLPRLADIRARFGDVVADIVLGCSDSTDEQWKRTVSYWHRKQAYLEHFAVAPREVVLVSLADKVHNSRAIVTDIQAHGPASLAKFTGSPLEILRYYQECLAIGRRMSMPDALVVPLAASVTYLEAELTTD